MTQPVSHLQMQIDIAMRAHHNAVEKTVLMAILYGHSTRDMNVTDIRRKGSNVMSTLILGKGGIAIKRVDTEIPFEWT